MIRKVFADLVRSGCPKKVPCARLAEALRRHALLDVTENDLRGVFGGCATIEERVRGGVPGGGGVHLFWCALMFAGEGRWRVFCRRGRISFFCL